MINIIQPKLPARYLPLKKAIKTKEKKFKLQGRYRFQKLPIAIENKAGSIRRSMPGEKPVWSNKMDYDYGFIVNTMASDGEGVDTYIDRSSNGMRENYHQGENEPEMIPTDVYVVHQLKIWHSKNWNNGICPDCHKHHTECSCPQHYDEDKVMLGFKSKDEAIKAYLGQYDSEMFLGPVSTYSIDEFRKVLKRSWGKKIPSKEAEHEHWHGFDLDGTLAKDDGWKGKDYIGDPIEKTRERIQKLLSEGKKVKLFTARASDPKAIPPIQQWMKNNNIPLLEITNKKDPGMVSLEDDRAIQVRKNTGNLVKGIPMKKVIERQVSKKNTEWICPHCNKEILEKSLYYNDGKYYHRCDTTKSIILPRQKNDIDIESIMNKSISSYYLDYDRISNELYRGDFMLPLFFSLQDFMIRAEELFKEFGKTGESLDDFINRTVRKIKDKMFMDIGRTIADDSEYKMMSGRVGVKIADTEMFDNVQKSCGKDHNMDKSYLGQHGDQGGSHAMLRENLGESYGVKRKPILTMFGAMNEIEKCYPMEKNVGESLEDFTRRKLRSISGDHVQAMHDRGQSGELEKSFVKVPAHTRKGKRIPAYTYFTDKERKIADVRHTKKTRVDYGKKEADKKIAELEKKKKHHDIQIEAAKEMKEKVESHKKSGNTHYKVGQKEIHVDEALKHLNDHIEHHTNENESHDNHIAKIKDRYKTEQAYWDKQREARKAKEAEKQKAIDELVKDGKHGKEVLSDDVLAVLKKMKEEKPAGKKAEKKPSKEKTMDDYFKEYHAATSKDQKASIAKKAQDKYMKDNPDATLRDFLVASRAYKDKMSGSGSKETPKMDTGTIPNGWTKKGDIYLGPGDKSVEVINRDDGKIVVNLINSKTADIDSYKFAKNKEDANRIAMEYMVGAYKETEAVKKKSRSEAMKGNKNAEKIGSSKEYNTMIPRMSGKENTIGSKLEDIYFDTNVPWPDPIIDFGRNKGKRLSEVTPGYRKAFLREAGVFLNPDTYDKLKFGNNGSGEKKFAVSPESEIPNKIVVPDDRRTDYTDVKPEGIPKVKSPEIDIPKPKKDWKPKVTEKGGNIHVDYSGEPHGEISIPNFRSDGFVKFTKKDLEMGDVPGPIQDAVNSFNKLKENLISNAENSVKKENERIKELNARPDNKYDRKERKYIPPKIDAGYQIINGEAYLRVNKSSAKRYYYADEDVPQKIPMDREVFIVTPSGKIVKAGQKWRDEIKVQREIYTDVNKLSKEDKILMDSIFKASTGKMHEFFQRAKYDDQTNTIKATLNTKKYIDDPAGIDVSASMTTPRFLHLLAHYNADRKSGYVVPEKNLPGDIQEQLNIYREDNRAYGERISSSYYEAYLKGVETSFGEKNAKDTLKSEYGVKIKRQNGKEMTDDEVEALKTVIDHTYNSMGNPSVLKKFAEERNLKISFSGDKNAFLRKAVGLYCPTESTVVVGPSMREVMPHEMTHFIDDVIGSKLGRDGDGKGYYASEMATSDIGMMTAKGRRTFIKDKRTSGKYWNRSCEVFARMVEQYAAKNDNNGDMYYGQPGYWSKEEFSKLEPKIVAVLKANLGKSFSDFFPVRIPRTLFIAVA